MKRRRSGTKPTAFAKGLKMAGVSESRAMIDALLVRSSRVLVRSLPLAFLLLLPSSAAAQDLFEIQVYPYDTVEPRHTMVEFHTNYFPSGTKTTEEIGRASCRERV